MAAYDSFLATTAARFDALDTSAPFTAVQPETTPASHLGHLAWSKGLDYWNSAWTDGQKRELIRKIPANKRIRGTRAAIDNALQAFLGEMTLTEWWEQSPEGTPGTATAEVALGTSLGTSLADQNNVLDILRREGRLACHVTLVLGVGGSSAIAPYAAARLAILSQHSGTQVGA